MNFEELGLRPELVEITGKLGWKTPTEIQTSAIPVALTGRDIIGLSETGSGKSAAFLLPILNDWLKKDKPDSFGLILTPTRELAGQIEEDIKALSDHLGIKTLLMTGSGDATDQITELASHTSHIVIATAGRILSLCNEADQMKYLFNTMQHLVLDEADQMLGVDFGSDVDKVVRMIPAHRSKKAIKKAERSDKKIFRQTQIYSATFEDKISRIADQLMYEPEKVFIGSQMQFPAQLTQKVFPMEHSDRFYNLFVLLSHHLILKSDEEVTEAQCTPSAIIFVRTCRDTEPISSFINKMTLRSVPLHSKMPLVQRNENLTKFKSGEANILVATDIACRGIHMENVRLVVNYSLPLTPEIYKHRVGRTARLGRTGTAVSMVYKLDVAAFKELENKVLGEKKMAAVTLRQLKGPGNPRKVGKLVEDMWRLARKEDRERHEDNEKLEETDALLVGSKFQVKREYIAASGPKAKKRRM